MDKTIKDVDWEAKNSESGQWNRFAYCNRSLTCITEQPTLPNGVKVTKVSKGNLILQPSAKTMTDGITELQCVVHYSDSTINTPLVIKIHYSNFTLCKFSRPACFSHMYKLLVDGFDANRAKFPTTHRLQV